MEATGVYWKPVWHILSDGDVALTLANAAHVKNVPGRKTDVNDATWLADLLAHGLIRGSFVPDVQTQEQRGLLRIRKQLVRERASHVQRLLRTLEDADIKLDPAFSDVTGLSGRAMIEALIAGETSPTTLANLAHRGIRTSPDTLRDALRGRVTSRHRFLLQLHLKQINAFDEVITGLGQEVDAHVQPFRAAVAQLKTIPGIGPAWLTRPGRKRMYIGRDGSGGGQGEGDQVVQLTGAVLALKGSVSGMAAVLEQQGEILRALLELTAAKPKESRLDERLVALIRRLDAHASAMKRVEAG